MPMPLKGNNKALSRKPTALPHLDSEDQRHFWHLLNGQFGVNHTNLTGPEQSAKWRTQLVYNINAVSFGRLDLIDFKQTQNENSYSIKS
jgi:hypothetical protein